jgi:hypothetical protein
MKELERHQIRRKVTLDAIALSRPRSLRTVHYTVPEAFLLFGMHADLGSSQSGTTCTEQFHLFIAMLTVRVTVVLVHCTAIHRRCHQEHTPNY